MCVDMLPSEKPTFPANGTRNWNTTADISNGTFIDTVIPYTCPPRHAFNRNYWTNDLDNKCIWSDTYQTATWKFWEAPGINMTDDPNKLLPDCVRKLIWKKQLLITLSVDKY